MVNFNFRIVILTFFWFSLVFSKTGYANDGAKLLRGPDTSFVLIQDDPIAAMLDKLIDLQYFDVQKNHPENKYSFGPDSVPTYDDLVYEARIAQLNTLSPFALDYNDAVKAYIEMYANRKREQVSRMLGLADLYFPMFEEKLDSYNMPLELKYLAIVESALNPQARSRSGAQGLWQFMYPTGKMFGLEVNSYVDERCDPYLSTDAACRYLQYLYKMYGDWQLVLAAYNCGPGTVNKAIRRSGGKMNYWDLRPFLPAETRGYVPAFIAVNYVMNYAEEHNLYPTRPLYYHYEVDTVRITTPVKFEQISTVLGVSMDEIQYLNPTYRKSIIPCPGGESLTLCLSKPMIASFINNEKNIYNFEKKEDDEPLSVLATTTTTKEVKKTHVVRSGEHLTGISKKYNCTIGDIREWNNLKSNSLFAGQKLAIYTTATVPVTAKSVASPAVKAKSGSETTGSKYVYYTVQAGDTLWDIAKSLDGVSVEDIKKWNNIKNGNSLKPGTKIKVSLPG